MNKKNIKYFAYFFGLLNIILPNFVLAFCPVCTIAVGAGVGLTRWLKVDDTITGLWIGGMTVSLAVWTIDWLRQKKIHFQGMPIIVTALYYLFIIGPLYYMGIMGHILNTIWGIDKLLLGIILGSAFFYLGGHGYKIIKAKRGKPHFPFQKVVMPVLPLVLLTILFYFLTK